MAETDGRVAAKPDDLEFAPIRADLARLFMQHRLDLGIALVSDKWIVEHPNDLTATLS
jgi:hypothetical protein